MKYKNKLLRKLREYMIITLGAVIYSIAFCWWYEPNNLSVGGFTGIAQIINHYFPVIPIGIMSIVMNIPLFVIGVRLLGKHLLTSSIYAMVVSYLIIDLIDSLYRFPTSDPLLCSLFGGVMVGVSAGIMMLAGSTTGGSELLARLLKYKYRHIPIGNFVLAIDLIVILNYTMAFHSFNNALYGIIALYVTSVAMNNIIYGSDTAKMAYIISDKSEEITAGLLDLDFGVTILDGKGAYSGNPAKVIMCVFKSREIAAIKELVSDIDKDAFIIVCEAHEVMGEGFGKNSPSSL
ncbi:YitT family protein [Lachnospiraceae bacterium C1.1]|nr:YitT family protein [Lachnospiraceae bacterium C1.1]